MMHESIFDSINDKVIIYAQIPALQQTDLSLSNILSSFIIIIYPDGLIKNLLIFTLYGIEEIIF